MPNPASKQRTFWPIVVLWLALDLVTKRLALATLHPGIPNEVLGEYLRWTLTFNRGAAMGMHLGEWSRPVFTAIGIGMLVVMNYLMIFWGVPAESPGTKWFYIYQEGYKALFR